MEQGRKGSDWSCSPADGPCDEDQNSLDRDRRFHLWPAPIRFRSAHVVSFFCSIQESSSTRPGRGIPICRTRNPMV